MSRQANGETVAFQCEVCIVPRPIDSHKPCTLHTHSAAVVGKWNSMGRSALDLTALTRTGNTLITPAMDWKIQQLKTLFSSRFLRVTSVQSTQTNQLLLTTCFAAGLRKKLIEKFRSDCTKCLPEDRRAKIFRRAVIIVLVVKIWAILYTQFCVPTHFHRPPEPTRRQTEISNFRFSRSSIFGHAVGILQLEGNNL